MFETLLRLSSRAEERCEIEAPTDNRELCHTQDTRAVCRCDGVAYYGVQECRHRGSILGRPQSHEQHRTEFLRHLDVVPQTSQQSTTTLRWQSCRPVMTAVGEGIAAHNAQLLGRSVAIATTRKQQRTAVTAHFLLCTLCC